MNLFEDLSTEGIGYYKESELASVYTPYMTISYQKRELLIEYQDFSIKLIHNYSSEPTAGNFNHERITERGYSIYILNNKYFDDNLKLYTKSSLKIWIDDWFTSKDETSHSLFKKYYLKGSQSLKNKIISDQKINEFLINNEVNILPKSSAYLILINPKEEVITMSIIKSHLNFSESLGLIFNFESNYY